MSGIIVESNIKSVIADAKKSFNEYLACILVACEDACKALCAEVQVAAQNALKEGEPGFFTGLLRDSIFTWISTEPDEFKLNQSMGLVDETKYNKDIKDRGLPVDDNAIICAIVGTYASRFIANEATYRTRLEELAEGGNSWAKNFLMKDKEKTLFTDTTLYAYLIEYGSGKGPVNPFLSSAIQSVREIIKTRFSSAIKSASDKPSSKSAFYLEKIKKV